MCLEFVSEGTEVSYESTDSYVEGDISASTFRGKRWVSEREEYDGQFLCPSCIVVSL
jgi:hypothetical protein